MKNNSYIQWKSIATVLMGLVMVSFHMNYNIVTQVHTNQIALIDLTKIDYLNNNSSNSISTGTINISSESVTSRNNIPNRNSVDSTIVVDIISIGSLLKQSFHNAQQDTFIKHDAIRNFYPVNELIDADPECSTSLSSDQINDVIEFCNTTIPANAVSRVFRKSEFRPKKVSGWICAQKRPIDGLYYVLNQYRNNTSIELPNYMFIIDDDTYLHMDRLLPVLVENFPYNTTHVVAGCTIYASVRYGVNFAYGGFGSFISRASIQRLLQPIYCTLENTKYNSTILSDPFNGLFCWRLKENLMGEQRFFVDGMSLIDLMYQYSYQQSFRNVAAWEDIGGYCLHSDQALAYFFNTYHIAVPDHELYSDEFRVTDMYRKKYKYSVIHRNWGDRRWKGECYNEYAHKCKTNIHGLVCHYIKPNEMLDIYKLK